MSAYTTNETVILYGKHCVVIIEEMNRELHDHSLGITENWVSKVIIKQ